MHTPGKRLPPRLKSRPFLFGTWVLPLSLEFVASHICPLCVSIFSAGWNEIYWMYLSTSHAVFRFHGTWVGNICVLGIFGKLTSGLFSTGNVKLLNVLLIMRQSSYFCALLCCRLCGMPEMQMLPPPLPGKDTPLCLVLISLSCFMKTNGLEYAEVLWRRDNIWGCVIFKWPFCHVEFMKSGILWTSATFLNHWSITTVIHQVPTLLQEHQVCKHTRIPMKHWYFIDDKIIRTKIWC